MSDAAEAERGRRRTSAESRDDFLRRNPDIAAQYPAEAWSDNGPPIDWRDPAKSLAAARRRGLGARK